MTLRNKALGAIVLLQAVIIVAVFWPGSSKSNVGKLLPDLEKSFVTEITITDSEGQSIRLARRPSGCVLPDAGNYPCVDSKFPDFLKQVTSVSTASLVAETKGSHQRLKVAEQEFERAVDFETSTGARSRLYVGTSTRGRSSHVRADGRDEVYLAPSFSAFDAPVQATGWVNPVYFSVPQDDVAAFALKNSGADIRLEKNEGGEWVLPENVAEGMLDQAKVQALVGKAGSLRLVHPLGKEELETYGTKDPVAEMTISTKDGENTQDEYILRFGTELDTGGGLVVKSSKSDYFVIMSQSTLTDFLNQTLEDLLEAPDTTNTGKTS